MSRVACRKDAVVSECMTADPDTIPPDDTIEHAAPERRAPQQGG
jgi:hypothetical protein